MPTASAEVIYDLNTIQTPYIDNRVETEQIFQLKYRVTKDEVSKKLVGDIYAYLYFWYDVKIFAHTQPYLDLYTNRYEYVYVKLGGLDGKIKPKELLDGFLKHYRDTAYELIDITETSHDNSHDYIYLNGSKLE
ncbi:hypothetical protein AZ66_29795 [Paenibacillus sp. E194]|uniref:hypothetical protein n=1 Tax=Paenibacillus sp. E194 TaxID=1458845 RepID=UPI0005C98474|nr:hypothetical protein [Paenibacillus sp. E194]KJB84638.1 hypothetical protein AZ66_29795 [Paenibacillus sp. E194]